jgi:tetratricopeptide (TPR) repeat protein
MLTGWRARAALEARDWPRTQRLHEVLLVRARQRALDALRMRDDELDPDGRDRMRSLANALTHMGDVLSAQARPEAVSNFREAADICRRIGDVRGEYAATFNEGSTYLRIAHDRYRPRLHDDGSYRGDPVSRWRRRARAKQVDLAERCYRHALELTDERGPDLPRANVLDMLGVLALTRFQDARAAREPYEDMRRHWEAARDAYLGALSLIPAEAVGELANVHSHLADLYGVSDDTEAAQRHFQEASRLSLESGDDYSAATNALGLAISLHDHGRLDQAQTYVESALRALAAHPGARNDIERAEMLLESIRKRRP